jgi:prepilin peptidase CpaA
MSLFTLSTLVGFLAASAWLDARSRRIPNTLTGAAMIAGLVLSTVHLGTVGFAASLAGLVVGATPLLVPFALGGVGGGDVKMMAAVGTFVGPVLVLVSLVFGMALGGIVMAAYLVHRGLLREKLTALAAALRVVRRRPGAGAGPVVALPYSVPLALGTVAAVALSGVVEVVR